MTKKGCKEREKRRKKESGKGTSKQQRKERDSESKQVGNKQAIEGETQGGKR